MEDDRGPAVTVIEGDAAPEPEAVAEAADAIEAQAEAAVEIAEVEAEAEVAIAEVQAEAAVEIAEAQTEAFADNSEWANRLAELEAWREQHGPPDHPAIWAALAEVQAMVLSLSEKSTPLPTREHSPENNPENPEVSEEANEGAEPGQTNSEPMPANEPEKPASAARKVRWI